ncbi:MAG: hypothetical protein LBR56_03505, partial [Sporomusaceae bacterium]|nr:hypothetical protein [Sporomusaceae bacterium]
AYYQVEEKQFDMRLDIKINYALLPVWLLTTRYQNKQYTFAINGQTGKLRGELPIDKNKLTKYLAASFIGVTALSYFALTNILKVLASL